MPTAAEITWIQSRITALETAIVAYETAMIALASGAQSYSLDTGQTRQSVTKTDVGSMRLAMKAAVSMREAYQAQLGGSSFIGIPGY